MNHLNMTFERVLFKMARCAFSFSHRHVSFHYFVGWLGRACPGSGW